MAGGRTTRGSRHRPRAASAVVPFPRAGGGDRLDLVRFVPSGRSLLVGFAIVAAVLGGYWGARVTSVFAVDEVDVQGAPPAVEREVRRLTRDLAGTSLLAIDPRAIEDSVRALPSVAGASVDRAFPHGLVIRVAAERPVAVVRRGDSAWLVTGSGKIVREIPTGTERGLPRIWLAKGTSIRVGADLPARFTPATRALAGAQDARLPRRVKAIRSGSNQLTLVLVRGPEIRLGDPSDVRLKLAVAARVLPLVAEDSLYLDVSVPERPVASRYLNSQVDL